MDPANLAILPFVSGELRVASYVLRERLSRPTVLDVVLRVAPEVAGRERELLGGLAVFTIASEGQVARRVEGVVERVSLSPLSGRGPTSLKLRLRSPLALLKHRKQSRIFQDQSVPDVIATVLAEAGLPCEMRLAGDHPPRNYVVQYRESDLAFVERLAAENHIAYFVSDGGVDTPSTAPQCTTVWLDDPGLASNVGAGPLPPSLPFRPEDGLGHEPNRVLSAARVDRTRSNAVHLFDYDFERPNLSLEEKARAEGAAGWLATLEAYHHFADHDAPEVSPTRAAHALASERRGASHVEGSSLAPGLAPGLRFGLEAPESPDVEGQWLVSRVDHRGHLPELDGRDNPKNSYQNTFVATPADSLDRPTLPRRRATQAFETATVVGPPGEAVHTDEFGRIKVEMHWDRRHLGSDKASAWVRVSQGWAGTSYGMVLIPRVGMEVLLGFLGGDPDCPVVVGCLYNATHPTPFALPSDKLTSGLRTQSVPSGGNNELSFDDQAGKERILLSAARDLEVAVANQHRVTVTGSQQVTVTGSRMDTVAGSQTQQTAGSLLAQVAGDRSDEIAGQQLSKVGAGRFATVFGGDTLTVKGTSLTTVEKEASLRVMGNYTAEVGSDSDPGTIDVLAWGDYVAGTGKAMQLRAQDGITLVCGESRIELTPKGITLRAAKVTLAASESLSVEGDGPALRLGKEAELVSDVIRLYAKKSSLELNEDAHVNGTQVKLNCGAGDPSEQTDDEGNPTTQKLKLALTDAMFEPYANKDFVLRAGGIKVEGTTDGDGKVDVDLPKEATTADITVWLEKRPTGKTRRYVVKIGEVPGAETAAGLETRLRNLGYYWGKATSELTPELAKSLSSFQQDHELAPTGELDDATKGKLVEVHGS